MSATAFDLANVLGGAVKTARRHDPEFPLAKIVVRPEENYRWGSEEAMRSDLAATTKDPSDGSTVCTYAILVDSIRTLGVEEPVGIVPRDDGTYRVVYGFTRVVAAKEVGLGHVPAYVYDAALPDEEAQLLQLRENSTALKRAVNWVAEVETYFKLVGYARKSLEKLPKTSWPRDDDGSHLTPKQAAGRAVGKALGVAPRTMKNRKFTLTHLDPRLKVLAVGGVLSYASASELVSGDVNVPFTAEFITRVLDEVKAEVASGCVTPETVRVAMRKVRDQDKEIVYKDGLRPVTTCGQWTPTARQSLGALKELTVSMWGALLAKHKMTLRSTAEQWESLKRTSVWHQVVGIGIGASEVTEPVIVTGDDTGRAELQHAETAFRYAASGVLQAALMADLAMTPDRFRDWMNNFSRDPDSTGGRIANRIQFHSVIRDVLAPATIRTPLHELLKVARAELKLRLGV